MRRLAASLTLVVCGCTSPPNRELMTSEVTPARVDRAPAPATTELPRIMTATLEPVPRSATAGSGGSRSFATGRMRVEVRPDGTVQYWLSLYNPALENVTAARILRGTGDRADAASLVLFSSATMRNKYIDVRGTAMITDPAGPGVLDELRTRPRDFRVLVTTDREPRGALRGTIQ
jgi:hypothetical protein